jgi:primosomal replication protein N''
MFDIVVFDEASQLPIESALPALFRAKRFVVSGDEKQLPPTNFFNTRFGSDDEVSPVDRLFQFRVLLGPA